MKSVDAEKKTSATAEKEAADDNLEEAKEHLENALKSGAAVAATLGAGILTKISEKLEDAAEKIEETHKLRYYPLGLLKCSRSKYDNLSP